MSETVDISGGVADGWFDTHCHVHDDAIPGGVDGAIEAAANAGVTMMVTVGCDRVTSMAALDVAARVPQVHATVGLHPHEARFGVDTIVDLFDRRAGGAAPVAVGECGLDYHYDHSPRAAQRDAFAAQIALARDLGLALVIHTREAWDDTFDVLAAVGAPERIVFHCFTGGPVEAERALALDAFLSFSGIVTFPSAADVRAAAVTCPADRLVIETDSPYLAPVPHRGRPNQPALVTHVGECLAVLRDVPLDRVRSETGAAARVLFGLDPAPDDGSGPVDPAGTRTGAQ
ncbi:TatD family hydrolase [soil metagenome]